MKVSWSAAADKELVKHMAEEIQREIDADIIKKMGAICEAEFAALCVKANEETLTPEEEYRIAGLFVSFS